MRACRWLALLLLYFHAATAYYFLGTTLSGEHCDSLGRCVASTFRRSAVPPAPSRTGRRGSGATAGHHGLLRLRLKA